MALASLQATRVSIDNFAATHPALRAFGMVQGSVQVIAAALDAARAAEDQYRFGVCMDVAERAAERMQDSVTNLRAEIARGKEVRL